MSQSEEGDHADENFVSDELQLQIPSSIDEYAGAENRILAHDEAAVFDDEDDESVYGPDQDFEDEDDEDEEDDGCLSADQANLVEYQ